MKSTEIAYIYALLEPNSLEVRYIGKTINPSNRLRGHINESKYTDHYKSRWIRSLLKQGYTPIFKILKICPLVDFVKHETELIKLYSVGRLVNSDKTGQGNVGRRREIIDKQAEKISRVVHQYDLNGNYIQEYNSVRDAARQLNLSHSNISRCCNGIFKHTGSFIFSYEKLDIVKSLISPNGIKKIVIELDSNGIILGRWNSLMDCSRATGVDNGNISRCCNDKLKSIKGRFFKFE